tara:strand:+ start:10653 stop:11156 length:504 start_codon:yes stop_codon:yes gene_type:complete
MALLTAVFDVTAKTENQLDKVQQAKQTILQHSPPTSEAGKTTTEQQMKICKASKNQLKAMMKEVSQTESAIESELEKLQQEIEALIKSRLEPIRKEHNKKLAKVRDFIQTEVIDEIESKERMTERDEDQLQEWTSCQEEELADLEEIEIDLSIEQYAEIQDLNTLPF